MSVTKSSFHRSNTREEYFGIAWIKKWLHTHHFSSDQHLLKQLEAGDSEAFGKLYMKYLDPLYRYIYFRVDQQQPVAEDLVETVFFKAWKNKESFFQEGKNFRAWLYAIAHNTVIDYYRQKKALSLHEKEDHIIDDKKTLEEEIEQKDSIASIHSALTVLTDEQRQVVLLKFVEEMSNKEIGKIMNKREDAVRALQCRALKKLREVLKM